jgi:hypothetical protein
MRIPFLVLSALATTLVAAPVAAQDSPAERAALARDAWRRAAASQRAGLSDSMWADVNRAHAAWPAQVAYAETVARQAARRGDDAALERVLRRLASQGVGLGAASDTTVARVAARSTGGAAALAALRASTESSEQSRPRVLLPDTTFFAEGLDVDPASGTLYVTSIHLRTVMAVKRDGSSRSAIVAPADAIAGAFGVAFDGTRGALWVTAAGTPHMRGHQPADSTRAELLRVNLADGSIAGRWRLGDGTGAPGELALTPAGDVLVSDGLRGRLYRLRGGAGALEPVTSPLLRSPQGIAPSADGAVAWVADWSHGLLRWDLRTNEVTAVTTPDDAMLLGIDGLRRAGDRLIGVQNGATPARVIAITLDATGRAVHQVHTIDRPSFEGEPTVGAVAGDRYLYVSSSAWPFWNDEGARRAGTAPLPPVTVRELRLPR